MKLYIFMYIKRRQNMKLDNADKFLLNLYYKDKTKLFPQEIEYCEKLIKKIILKITDNDLIKNL